MSGTNPPPPGLYRQLRDNVLGLWNASWTHLDVPVYWRSDDLENLPDPSTVPHFLRNEVDPGMERTLAYGGGRGKNLKAQFGSVKLRTFTARSLGNEDEALDLMADAVAIFRSVRLPADPLDNNLSFIGEGSGFDQGPTEDGNWFMRATMVVFEYRFLG